MTETILDSEVDNTSDNTSADTPGNASDDAAILQSLLERASLLQKQMRTLEKRISGKSRDLAEVRTQKLQMILVEQMRRDGEAPADTRRRLVHDQMVTPGTPLDLVHRCVRILIQRLTDLCTMNNLRCWPELSTVRGFVRRQNLEVYTERGSFGMPAPDLTRLMHMISNEPNFEVLVEDHPNKNGTIRTYRFRFRDQPIPFIDVFSYHFASASSAPNARALWSSLVELRQSHAAECNEVPDDDQERLAALLDEYIRRQDELGAPSNGPDWLVWGIENFQYGALNILDAHKLFPLDHQPFGDCEILVPHNFAWFRSQRDIDTTSLISELRIPALNKMPPSKVAVLTSLINRFGNSSQVINLEPWKDAHS